MWERRRLTTLWAFMACYRDNFTFTFFFYYAYYTITIAIRIPLLNWLAPLFRIRVQISAQKPAIQTDICRDFPRFIQATTRIVP
jgi:prephenate dehydrogenase